MELNDKWVLWSHKLYDNRWGIESYKKIFEFDTIDNFWRLYNNFDILGGLNKKNYFLMRKGINPTWEDENNRHGGTCSIKISLSKSAELWTELSCYLIGETFLNNMSDINGISICPKSIWSIVKIWNKDGNNDITDELPEAFTKKYIKCSIKYKKNEAEY